MVLKSLFNNLLESIKQNEFISQKYYTHKML